MGIGALRRYHTRPATPVESAKEKPKVEPAVVEVEPEPDIPAAPAEEDAGVQKYSGATRKFKPKE